ncbi:MAG: hypothetical protein A2017_09260 [Lentisphaerae bacterium GWF2_44_16]|nr:MAG: hypothetical protein A2017_09260 [Lentisphaerae bacterium GWF2_44_16]
MVNNFLKEIRSRKGLSQKGLAQKTGISQQLISAFERNPKSSGWRKISNTNLELLGNVLNIKPEIILNGPIDNIPREYTEKSRPLNVSFKEQPHTMILSRQEVLFIHMLRNVNEKTRGKIFNTLQMNLEFKDDTMENISRECLEKTN